RSTRSRAAAPGSPFGFLSPPPRPIRLLPCRSRRARTASKKPIDAPYTATDSAIGGELPRTAPHPLYGGIYSGQTLCRFCIAERRLRRYAACMLRIISTCMLLVFLAPSASTRLRAQAAADLVLPLRLTAFAVNMSNIGPGAAG